MKTLFKATMAGVLSVFLATSCMQSEGGSPTQSTDTPEYNQDTRTPERSDRKGDYEKTHKPNTGPDNDSDSMQ